MNYKSKPIPVLGKQFYSDNWQESEYLKRVITDANLPFNGTYRLKEEYGETIVKDGFWIVEFPNGEVHVIREDMFPTRFEKVEVYTPEEVKNAISMARTLAVLGGESS